MTLGTAIAIGESAGSTESGKAIVDHDVKHHFAGGIYAKEMKLAKGHKVAKHVHTFSHLSILAEGVVLLKMNDLEQMFTAPACVHVMAGVQHEITALEDVTWFCIHKEDR